VSNFRYHAFISYSHAADGQLAPALQSGLQRFAKPWYWLRAIRVFRDETGLAVTPELWESIESGLRDSAYFILLASAKAADSKWVEQEVDWWLRNRTSDRLLIVWTDGELTWDGARGDFDWTKSNALPRRLEKAFEAEPLFLDFRWARTATDLSLRSPQFLGAVARLSATLQNKPLDELIGDDVNRHSTVQRLLRFAVIALAVVAAGAIFAAVVASQARKMALGLAEGARAKEQQAAIENAHAEQKLKELKDKQEFQAEQTRVSRQLANRALTVLPLDRELGILLASEAVRTMATSEAEDVLRRSLFEARTAESVLKGHTGAVYALNFSSDGKRLITGSADKTAQIWETATGRPLVKLTGHESNVTHTGFNSDGKRVFTASDDKSVRFWDAATGKNLVAMLHEDSIRSLQLSPDGKSMLTACLDSKGPELWDVVSGKRLFRMPGGRLSAAFSPTGKQIVVANFPWIQDLAICDAEKGTVLVETRGHTNLVWDVAFSPDGQTLVSASFDQTARLWETATGQELQVLRGHGDSVDGVAFSPDGKLVLTRGRDTIVQVWEVATGRNVAKLRGHEDRLNSAVFSSNSKWILTASWDKTSIVWDARNGRKVVKLDGHAEPIATAAFSPDGKQAATACWDGAIRLFDCDVCGSIEDLLKLATKRVTRSLTSEERQKYLTESAPN
jgi:WD40 repeat protein